MSIDTAIVGAVSGKCHASLTDRHRLWIPSAGAVMHVDVRSKDHVNDRRVNPVVSLVSDVSSAAFAGNPE